MLSFKMFAGTDVGLRENNEDNFTVCPDLTKNEWVMPADHRQAVPLGSRGCVMVVADGMGGQNAGEVASAIAVATVQDMFSPERMPSDAPASADAAKAFLKKVVAECDARIKQRTETDPETDGMGSTIVIAWLAARKLYIAWLGDSRAYSFVKGKGIARLSKDHSYVQQLVDAGALTDDEAMRHPDSNIITRSLGDTSQRAKAEVAEYDVEDNQVILLCSDGLCGVCRDEEIGGIIEDEAADLQRCKERLASAALAAGGSDNITISLLHIEAQGAEPSSAQSDEPAKGGVNWTALFANVFALCLFGSLIYAGVSLFRRTAAEEAQEKSVRIWLDEDTLSSNKPKTTFHIAVVGDSVSEVRYDKSLISVSLKDSIVSVCKTKSQLTDTVASIIVVCRRDAALADTAKVFIRKSQDLPDSYSQTEGKKTSAPKLRDWAESKGKTSVGLSSAGKESNVKQKPEGEAEVSSANSLTPSQDRPSEISRITDQR